MNENKYRIKKYIYYIIQYDTYIDGTALIFSKLNIIKKYNTILFLNYFKINIFNNHIN